MGTGWDAKRKGGGCMSVKYVEPQTITFAAANIDEAQKTKMTDDKIGTQAEFADVITLQINATLADSIAFFTVEAQEIYIKITGEAGNVVFERIVDFSHADYTDIWGYFYDDFVFKDGLYLDIPITLNAVIDIEIRNPLQTAKIGHLVIGRSKAIGKMIGEPSTSIVDDSTETTDAEGNKTLTDNGYEELMNINIAINKKVANAIKKSLKKIRSKTILWIASGEDETLMAYGFYKELSLVYPKGDLGVYDLEIKERRAE